MDFQLAIFSFMDGVGEDHRIGPTHISLFLAILYFYREQGCSMPIYVYRKELMKQAKISAVATYHKGMRDLVEYGYIGYVPSYNPVLGSLVYLMEMKGNGYSQASI
jgi:hypothetical protein